MLNQQNRKAFLHNVSLALGRNDIPENVQAPDLSEGPQHKKLAGLDQEGLIEAFRQECNNLNIKFCECDGTNLGETVLNVVKEYGGGKVIYPKNEEMERYGINKAFKENQGKENLNFVAWDNELSRERNIDEAQDANIGITFPVMGIAETGTVLQPQSKESGRSIGLLPLTHIAILKKSTIVASMTQSMKALSDKYHNDKENFPSQVVHISGPSSTVDIELVRVVGVHGPINVTYILVNE